MVYLLDTHRLRLQAAGDETIRLKVMNCYVIAFKKKNRRDYQE